jgi:MFS family permease
LLLVRVLSALGLGVFTPAAFSLLADLYPSTRRGRAAGLIHGMGFLGSIIAFGVLPALAARGPEAWRWGFVLLGLASCCTGMLLFLGVHEPACGATEPELYAVVQCHADGPALTTWTDLRALAAIPSWRLMLHAAGAHGPSNDADLSTQPIHERRKWQCALPQALDGEALYLLSAQLHHKLACRGIAARASRWTAAATFGSRAIRSRPRSQPPLDRSNRPALLIPPQIAAITILL